MEKIIKTTFLFIAMMTIGIGRADTSVKVDFVDPPSKDKLSRNSFNAQDTINQMRKILSQITDLKVEEFEFIQNIINQFQELANLASPQLIQKINENNTEIKTIQDEYSKYDNYILSIQKIKELFKLYLDINILLKSH